MKREWGDIEEKAVIVMMVLVFSEFVLQGENEEEMKNDGVMECQLKKLPRFSLSLSSSQNFFGLGTRDKIGVACFPPF